MVEGRKIVVIISWIGLLIGFGCSLLPPPVADVDFPVANAFLPHLKKLKIYICIGPWSPLFERERPLLTELELRCPHIGMTPRSKFNWIDVPYSLAKSP